MFDILVAGEINPDLVLTGDVEPVFSQVEKIVDSATLAIGSSSAIFAAGAARLGLKIAIVGHCGADVFGRFMLAELSQRGVDIENVIVSQTESTGLSVILSRGPNRAILTHLGLIPALQAADITDQLLRQARHLHVASYFLQTALQRGLQGLFRRARALGLTTSLDTNYDPSEKWTGVEKLLSLTNVFLPNEKEALSLTRQATVQLAADWLGSRVETLAVKLGEAGGLGVHDGQRAHVPSLHVKVVDTTGAGDSFNAGFLFGYLHGWELEKSLRMGCACGALSTQKAGGVEAQPTLDEVMKHVPG